MYTIEMNEQENQIPFCKSTTNREMVLAALMNNGNDTVQIEVEDTVLKYSIAPGCRMYAVMCKEDDQEQWEFVQALSTVYCDVDVFYRNNGRVWECIFYDGDFSNHLYHDYEDRAYYCFDSWTRRGNMLYSDGSFVFHKYRFPLSGAGNPFVYYRSGECAVDSKGIALVSEEYSKKIWQGKQYISMMEHTMLAITSERFVCINHNRFHKDILAVAAKEFDEGYIFMGHHGETWWSDGEVIEKLPYRATAIAASPARIAVASTAEIKIYKKNLSNLYTVIPLEEGEYVNEMDVSSHWIVYKTSEGCVNLKDLSEKAVKELELKELCKRIELPEAITEQVLRFCADFDFSDIDKFLEQYREAGSAEEGWRRVSMLLEDDEEAMKILSCMLRGAVDAHRFYRQKQISDEIYYETMKCFTRILEENHAMTGKYEFEREGWTARQVECRLFRIGSLEYEIKKLNDRQVIEIHIPTGADLSKEAVDDSLKAAKEFFGTYFPELAGCPYRCHSWMLAGEMELFLPESSNIVQFRKRFDIYVEGVMHPLDYFPWIYQTIDLKYKEIANETTLQKKLKMHLWQGGDLENAIGFLKE